MDKLAGTFSKRSEFDKARASLDRLNLPYTVLSPDPGFAKVGVPSLVLDEDAHKALYQRLGNGFTCSGWVRHRLPGIAVPAEDPRGYEDDVFGEAAVMVLAPCVADMTKIRLIAHISGDLRGVFPYMNAVMREASYNAAGPTFTFMDGYRMISIYARRIAVAKADEIVDAWRMLEMIRRRANEVWQRRHEIDPSYERRERPPALEIYRRLPRTNCQACGERTCMAFAIRLHMGELPADKCRPVFTAQFAFLKDALLEICSALGVADDAPQSQETPRG